MRVLGAQARASFREWWPELLSMALLTLIAFCGQRDDFLFSVFCVLIGSVFWAMGHRHRRLPLHKVIDDIWNGIRRMDARTEAATAPQQGQAQEPEASVRHLHSV